MTDAAPDRSTSAPRQLACARCGAAFTCHVGGPCWCGEVAIRLPLPKPAEPSPTGFDDCLCRDCLQALAAQTPPQGEAGS